MTEETKLLPCPFCGGAPEVVPSRRQPSYTPTYSIRCAICRARGPSETWTRPEAIDLWNKRAMPLQDHGTMAEAIHMLIRLVRMKVLGDEPNEVKFAFAALRGEPVTMWQPISTIPSSDDLVWLANSKTLSIEGPRAPGVLDADSFDLWRECSYPPLPAMVAEQETRP